MAEGVIDSIWSTVGGVLSAHGPAVPAAAASYTPGDFSVHFFLQLAVILLACRVVGWAGKKFLGQPQVVGEMIAGVILGPSLLGLLFPGLQGAIFPKETRSVLYAGSQLGVGLYMFLVGTTLQLDKFKSKAKSAMSVSFAGIAALGRAGKDAPRDQRHRERQRIARVAIRPFRREQVIPDQQARQHRFRRDVEGRKDEAAEDEHDHRQLQQEDGKAVLLLFLFHGPCVGGLCKGIAGRGRATGRIVAFFAGTGNLHVTCFRLPMVWYRSAA